MLENVMRFVRYPLRQIGFAAVLFYLSLTAFSVVAAHVMLVLDPELGLGQRLVAPLGQALVFVDTHWKPVLMFLVPFAMPTIRELLPRLRKAGSLEFDPVPLEDVAVREKPTRSRPGDR